MRANDRRVSPALVVVGVLASVIACVHRHHTVEPYRSDPVAAAALVTAAERLCLERTPPDEALPEAVFVTDGCSAWPDGRAYVDCCVEHDLAYWCGGSPDERRAADDAFGRCVAERSSAALGGTMRLGVRLGGHPFFPVPYRWGFGHPYRGGYRVPDPDSDPRPGRNGSDARSEDDEESRPDTVGSGLGEEEATGGDVAPFVSRLEAE